MLLYQRTDRPIEVTLDLPGLGLFAHLNVIAGMTMRLGRRNRPFRVRCVTPNYAVTGNEDWFATLFDHTAAPALDGQSSRLHIRRQAHMPTAWRGEMLSRLSVENGFLRQFRVARRWQEEVDRFVAAHFQGEPTLGLHYRGTDKSLEAERVDYSVVISRLRDCCDRHGLQRVFVATDEHAFLETLRSTPDLPVDIVAQSHVARSTGSKPMHLGHAPRKGSHAAADALVDCLILARCAALLKTWSALSGWSALFAPRIPVEFLNRTHPQGWFFPDNILTNEPPTPRVPLTRRP